MREVYLVERPRYKNISEAEREIAIWFKENEIMQYTTAQERIMYDINFDGSRE